MYKATIRKVIRHSINRLNQGDYSLLIKMAHPDVFIAFPGYNSWAEMFRPQVKNRKQHPTHVGIEECTAFAERFVSEGIQFDIEDILVNGPPWNTRIALRINSYKPNPDGGADLYNNRLIALLTTRWGRLVAWEDYEDPERTAAWDAAVGASSAFAADRETAKDPALADG